MSAEAVHVLLVLAYVGAGTTGLAWLITWLVKRFGPPR